MNKEIKEILEYVLSLTYGNENAIKGVDKVVDYITNLEQENKKLKELCDKYEEEHNTTFEYWKQLIKEDYESRCEKAIEVLERHTRYSTGELLSILQGENNDI